SSTCVAILTISNLRNVTLSSLYAFPTILRCDSRLLLRSSSEFWFALEERRRDRSSAALAIRVEPARAVASDSRVLARLGAPPPRSGRAGDAPRGTGAAAHPGDHVVVDPAVARDHRGRVEIHGIAHQIRDPSAGLLDEEAGGGDVPRAEAERPQAVESTGGDPREIEDGGAESTHAAAAKRE